MPRHDLPEQPLCIVCLPNDVLHSILLKLDFRDKINAGLVCKEWEQLLQAGDSASRHWEIVYSISDIARSSALRACMEQSPQELSAPIGRWFAKQAPAIKSVCLLADFFYLDDREKATNRMFLEIHLPMLADCLSDYAPTLEFEFTDGFPFDGPLLSSPGFMTLLCPMVKRLRLMENSDLISPAQFATICELTCLEELDISDSDWSSGGVK